jgi:hypothetical protein
MPQNTNMKTGAVAAPAEPLHPESILVLFHPASNDLCHFLGGKIDSLDTLFGIADHALVLALLALALNAGHSATLPFLVIPPERKYREIVFQPDQAIESLAVSDLPRKRYSPFHFIPPNFCPHPVKYAG